MVQWIFSSKLLEKKAFLHYIKVYTFSRLFRVMTEHLLGMFSPLIGIAGVNSLLFASYGVSKRIISPFPHLSLKEIAAAGAMAGAANAILASPGVFISDFNIFPKPTLVL